MHVIQFLPALFFGINIERAEAPVPKAEMGLIMDRGWQTEAGQHLTAPRIVQVFPKRFEDAFGRFLFKFLNDQRGRFGGLWFQQQMEVLGHQDPADEQAVHLIPDFLQTLDEVMTEAWGEENGRPAIGAGGDELSSPGL